MQSRIGYVNIHVTDVGRSVAFFRDALGFRLEFHDPAFGYARFDAGGVRFGVAAGEGEQARRPGDLHTGIGIVVPDVDAASAELKARGVRFTMEPQKQPWGGYMAMFADPDGNVFYLDGAA